MAAMSDKRLMWDLPGRLRTRFERPIVTRPTASCHRPSGPDVQGRPDGVPSADNRTPPPGSASCAESVASATDPRNLIRLIPAKEAGPSTR